MPRPATYMTAVETIIREIETANTTEGTDSAYKSGQDLGSYDYLKKKFSCSTATIQKVVEELRHRGYVVRASHRNKVQYPPHRPNPAQTNHRIICVLLPETLTDQFWAAVLEGILQRINEINDLSDKYVVVVYHLENKDKKGIRELMKNLRSDLDIRGLICIPPYDVLESDFQVEGKPKLPTVYVDRFPPDRTFPAVMAENTDGAKRAIEHLWEVGCRRFYIVPEGTNGRGSYHFTVMPERIDGCEEAISGLRTDYPKIKIESVIHRYPRSEKKSRDYRYNPGYIYGSDLLKNDVCEYILDPQAPPLGILCLQHNLAEGMWRAIQEFVKDPAIRQLVKAMQQSEENDAELAQRKRLFDLERRFALMSFDDTPTMQVLEITSMVNPANEIGCNAVTRLDAMLNNQEAPTTETERCYVGFDERDSTKTLRHRS